MSLAPLLWLGALWRHGQRRPLIWWALAGALSVSWMADTIAQTLPAEKRWVVSSLYPIFQVLLIGAALVPRREWQAFVWWLCLGAVGDASLVGLGQPDMFLHTFAWGAILLLVWRHREALPVRWLATLSFGLGWLGWLAYMLAPGWGTWCAYQGVRAVGIGLFCWVSAPKRVTA